MRRALKKMSGRNICFKLVVSLRKFPGKKIMRDGLRIISNLNFDYRYSTYSFIYLDF